MPTTFKIGDVRGRLDELLEHYRQGLRDRLDDLSEQEARARLVPSNTTLLGLVKHAIYLERFYFDHAVTGRSLKDLGVATTPARSFVLTRHDTIASVRAAHQEACADSRRVAAGLGLDDVVSGGRGRQTVWVLYLQVLRDLAHHSGHADILREQTLAARSTPRASQEASR